MNIKFFIVFILIFIFAKLSFAQPFDAANKEIRENLVVVLNSQLFVRETNGYNRGYEVDMYNKSVKASMGSSWCGAFVGYNLTDCRISNPNSAWSPDYAKPQDIIWTYTNPHSKKPLSGDVVTYYYSNLGRVGHTGFYISTDQDGYFITIEGNTGSGMLNRDGDGVYKRKRSQYQVHAITRYIK